MLDHVCIYIYTVYIYIYVYVYIILSCIILKYIILYYTILSYIILYYTILYYIILYYIIYYILYIIYYILYIILYDIILYCIHIFVTLWMNMISIYKYLLLCSTNTSLSQLCKTTPKSELTAAKNGATGRPVGQSLTTISSDVWKWSGSGDISVPSGYD